MSEAEPKPKTIDGEPFRVFLGWSGGRSKSVADALHGWLRRVLQSVKPFMSEFDIASGAKWEEVIATQLALADFGVVCLTPENYEKPWVLFESGALSAMGRPVCPYLFDLSNTSLKGPLTVFQNRSAKREDTWKLVSSVNDLLGGIQKVEVSILKESFKLWWPQLEAKLKAIQQPDGKEPKPRGDRELLEELLSLVREIARRSSRTTNQQILELSRVVNTANTLARAEPPLLPGLSGSIDLSAEKYRPIKLPTGKETPDGDSD